MAGYHVRNTMQSKCVSMPAENDETSHPAYRGRSEAMQEGGLSNHS